MLKVFEIFSNDHSQFWHNDYAKLPQSFTCLFFGTSLLINAYNMIYNLLATKYKKRRSEYDPIRKNMSWIFVI